MTRQLPKDRVAAEQNRRMRSCFDETAADDAEVLVRMARTRALRNSARFLPRRAVPAAWGALVGVLACGSAMAYAVQAGHLRLFVPDTEQETLVEEISHEERKAKGRAQQRLVVPAQAPETSAEPEETVPEADDFHLGTASPSKAVTQEMQPRRNSTAAHPPRVGEARSPRPRTKSSEERAATWAKVAQSLREGNGEAADEELAPLSKSNSPAERDAALLLRLQIKLGKQRASYKDVQALRALAEDGASPSVKASARRLLDKLRDD